MAVDMPVRKTMCDTCPFREGSKYEYLRQVLSESAMTEATRICHSTGSNGIHHRTGLPDHVCRGARDLQLRMFAATGFISDATDEAWNEQRVQIGMKPQVVCDPIKPSRGETMNNLEANQRSSDHCYLSNRAFRLIAAAVEKKIGRKLSNWQGPEIVTEGGTYKLDWHPPDDAPVELTDEAITLYDDGVWQFYGKDGDIEDRILQLHDRRWVQRMIDDEVNGVIAWGAVQFFKALRVKDKK